MGSLPRRPRADPFGRLPRTNPSDVPRPPRGGAGAVARQHRVVPRGPRSLRALDGGGSHGRERSGPARPRRVPPSPPRAGTLLAFGIAGSVGGARFLSLRNGPPRIRGRPDGRPFESQGGFCSSEDALREGGRGAPRGSGRGPAARHS